ncbi:MAG: trigger factor family protein [Gammaproteobacteria bacterium]|nr:trigger factor family protein [Gammaproteobacteria bacterium]
MEISVEDRSELRKDIQIRIPATDYQTRINSRVNELASNAQLPGFRKGKVPRQLISQRYGKALNAEVHRDLIDETMYQALQDKNLDPVALFDLDFEIPKENEDFVYKVTAEILGPIDLSNLSEIKIEKPKIEVTDEFVDRIVHYYQLSYSEWKEGTDATQGEIRFSFEIEDLDAEDTESENSVGDEESDDSDSPEHTDKYVAQLIVGVEYRWQDATLVSELLDMKVGEFRELHAEAPPNPEEFVRFDSFHSPVPRVFYHDEKRLDVRIKLVKIEQATLASIEQVLEQPKVFVESEDELRESIRTTYSDAADSEVKRVFRKLLQAKLIQHSGIVLPEYAYNSRVMASRDEVKEYLGLDYDKAHIGFSDSESTEPEDSDYIDLTEIHKKQTAIALATEYLGQKLVQKYNPTIENDEFQSFIEGELLHFAGGTVTQEMVEKVSEPENLRSFALKMKIEKSWDRLQEEVDVQERDFPYDQLQTLRSVYEVDVELEIDEVEETETVEKSEDDAIGGEKDQSKKGLLSRMIGRFKGNKDIETGD